MIWPLLLSVVLLVANGFFVAVEFALVGARATRLEAAAEAGERGAQLALGQMRDLNLQLAGAQLGITMASLGLGYVAEPAIVHGLEDLFGSLDVPDAARRGVALVLGLSIVVFFHMVFGEMVPKNLAITAPERSAVLLARPNRWYLAVFGPVVRILNRLALGGLRLLRVQPRDEVGEAPTARDLAAMLSESHGEGLIEDFAHDLLTGVLDFGGRPAESVMVPRDDIVAVSRSTPAHQVEALVRTSGHSRLPVLGRDLDDPLGFVHAKDLLTHDLGAGTEPLPARLVRRMPVVAPGRSCDDLLRIMRHTGVHVALVVDAAGVTRGMVTLEDLLEELVGDILDESDPADTDPAS